MTKETMRQVRNLSSPLLRALAVWIVRREEVQSDPAAYAGQLEQAEQRVIRETLAELRRLGTADWKRTVSQRWQPMDWWQRLTWRLKPSDLPPTGERALWWAVIQQAVREVAYLPLVWAGRRIDRPDCTPEDALDFLTTPGRCGPVCRAVGIDPKAVRRETLALVREMREWFNNGGRDLVRR